MTSKIYCVNIEEETLKNTNFRKVLYTTKNLQLVIMSIEPKDNIPRELHKDHDQFIRIESGVGKAIITDESNKVIEEHDLKDGIAIIIPANTWHEIKNTDSSNPLKLYSLYSPPEHAPDRVDFVKPQSGGGKIYKIKNRYNI